MDWKLALAVYEAIINCFNFDFPILRKGKRALNFGHFLGSLINNEYVCVCFRRLRIPLYFFAKSLFFKKGECPS